jgi:hypothetical protein
MLILTLNLLTATIVAPPSNASKWQMVFNSAFKGLIHLKNAPTCFDHYSDHLQGARKFLVKVHTSPHSDFNKEHIAP